jgi:type I restriction enzyme S subunit
MAYEIKYRSDNEMKDSGIEWLGKIPKEWEVTSLGKVATIQTGNTPSMQSTKDYYENGNVLWVKPDNLSEFEIITDTQEKINKYGISKAKKVPPFTPLVCCIGSIGKFGYSDRTVTYNQQINSIEFNCKKIFWKYGLYFISSQKDQHWYYSNGNVVQILNAQGQKKIKLPLVSLQDQQKIANFLDIKTAEFDSIISKKEQLIEKLEEAKKSLISEVVTGKVKIVDGELVDRKPEEMKDSGVEWLGMIPKDWVSTKIKHISRQIIDGTHSTPNYVEEGIPFLRVTDITSTRNGDINLDEVKYISFDEHKQLIKRCKPEKGDVLVSKNGTIGIPKVIDWDYEFSIFVSLALIKVKKNIILPEWIYYFFKSNLVDQQIAFGGKKSTIVNLHLDKIKEFDLPIMSKKEQNEFIRFLNDKVFELDNIITKTQQQITKLKEAKQSLISEAVTGKIDLRDWEIIETGGR